MSLLQVFLTEELEPPFPGVEGRAAVEPAQRLPGKAIQPVWRRNNAEFLYAAERISAARVDGTPNRSGVWNLRLLTCLLLLKSGSWPKGKSQRALEGLGLRWSAVRPSVN